MTKQPKLELETAEPWEHVAREFGDHDMKTEGGWDPLTYMERVDDAYYIGDWLPVEPVCKEVVRLRDMVMGSTADRDERDALRAKLDEWEKVAPELRAELKQTIKMYDETDLAIRKIAEERDTLRAKLDGFEAAAKEMVGTLKIVLEDNPGELMETVMGVVGSYRLWRKEPDA